MLGLHKTLVWRNKKSNADLQGYWQKSTLVAENSFIVTVPADHAWTGASAGQFQL